MKPSPKAPKAPKASGSLKPSGVYVLQQGTKYYVGKSADIAKRIKEHKRGTTCCRFTARCKRIRPLTSPVMMGEDDDWESWERNETLTRMYEFGIDNVRGWMFSTFCMSAPDQDTAFRQVCEKFDLCRRCGRAAHFASDCTATRRTVWGERL